MSLEPSELILNDDGSIYHLNLKPDQLADTIITVGDPDRVNVVTSFFDDVECKVRKREFHTQTGTYKGKRISVVSTGIGTDNIDIVFNELDALANIDLETRKIKKNLKQLTIVRIGTSGALQKETPLDSFLISENVVGFDSLWHYYQHPDSEDEGFLKALKKHIALSPKKPTPYYVEADTDLVKLMRGSKTATGTTATNVGFYAPQGRMLRAKVQDTSLVDKLASFEYRDKKITNMEMETSGIYAMAKILGHKAISMNAILANRATGEFSKAPKELAKNLIGYVLKRL